ncbi:uncharacterized membrane protein YsdA (DUF1294 family)/cold shock CspA family protein [Psychrobacter luti]|uniref:Uncharacterized membrane protein YsdA (DUF1294 family)/cold shock CspA family protein n=1 Tax=Psychrobacter luti TaxID=198481 RepID=A0A839TCG9_9GAMM|nr:DUF1294 domain-containing protein [Psychrobacter luti]MBB3106868.1 uncharacterized membrane protein YsdA (DUF1294 family)/cold shock CspA family protein [Psychrobacter luti]
MAKLMANKQQGYIKKWQEDKGFGFIETEAGESVFFHVSAFKAQRCPEIGEQVVFTVGQDNQGRLQAKDVQELSFVQQKMAQKNSQIRQRNHKRSAQAEFEAEQKKRLFLGIGFYGVLILFVFMNKLSWLVLAWYAILGIITYGMYAKDKAAAQSGDWRTPESTLHILSALGGWVGAMVAQTYLRHKSQKPEFRIAYYLTVIINLAGLLFILAGKDFAFLANLPFG